MTNARRAARTNLAAFATLAALVWAASSLAADTTRETRTVSAPITTVRLIGPIDLSINQGETRGVALDATAEELAKIEVTVSGGELTIRYEQGKMFWQAGSGKRAPRATVTMPELRKVAVIGSGDVAISPFNLNEGKLEVEVTGSGDVSLSSLRAKAFAVSIRGSGDVSASGQVASQDIAIAGSGDYRASDLQSQTAAIAIKGSGDAKVWAADALSVSIAGSGDVVYRGQPKLSQSIAGSGEVHQLR